MILKVKSDPKSTLAYMHDPLTGFSLCLSDLGYLMSDGVFCKAILSVPQCAHCPIVRLHFNPYIPVTISLVTKIIYWNPGSHKIKADYTIIYSPDLS